MRINLTEMAAASTSSLTPQKETLTVSLPILAGLIDHSLLHPTLTDSQILEGLQLARTHRVAAACVRPDSVVAAHAALAGSGVKVCAVAGFPHGSSTTAGKVAEALEAVAAGADEIDVVVNVGKALSGNWDYVHREIAAVNKAITTSVVGSAADWRAAEPGRRRTAVLKVIFENDFLGDAEIIRLCEICTEIGVAFVKTSTGYGFIKGKDGKYSYQGATLRHLRLMRKHCGPDVQIKAAGGVRTLDDLLDVMAVGATRVGATATEAIFAEAKERGIGEEPAEVEVEFEDERNGP
jgi:deoxyribose-phosphate aldolase